MAERPKEAGTSTEHGGSAEPTDEEMSEILADLEFFLDMQPVETLPLDEAQNGNGAAGD